MSKTGWKCPVCGKGMAPWVPSCDCVSKSTTSWANMNQCTICLNWYSGGHFCSGRTYTTTTCGPYSMADQMTLWADNDS